MLCSSKNVNTAGMWVYGGKKVVFHTQVWFGVCDAQVVSVHFRAPNSLSVCLWLLFLLFVVMIRKWIVTEQTNAMCR